MTVKETVCSFDNLYKAMKKCKQNVMWKQSVQGYYKNGLVNICELRKSLLNDTYKIDKYTSFKIFEPKERDILATRFKDRVFQRSLCDNYIYKEITKSFIYDNCACQIGKGTEFARKRLGVHLQKYYRHCDNEGYILKLDIKNYFGSTPHWVAKAAIAKRISDEWAREQVYKVIDSYGDIGLGLGSQLTQLIQLAVLDDIDHFIKEQLHIKPYVRYMDDSILIHEDKKYLKYCKEQIAARLEQIGLKLNEEKSKIFKIKQGVNFLGFKFKLTNQGKVTLILLKKKKFKEKRKLKKLILRQQKAKMTGERVNDCFESFLAHLRNTENHIKRCSYKVISDLKSYYQNIQTGAINRAL